MNLLLYHYRKIKFLLLFVFQIFISSCGWIHYQENTQNSTTTAAEPTSPATPITPTITETNIVSVNSTTADGTYSIGANLDIDVIFSNSVVVSSGTPTLTLNSNTNAIAVYLNGSGTTTLTFRYTVNNGDSTSDLDYSAQTSLNTAGATIKDSLGNNANLNLPIIGGGSSLGSLKNILINTSSPTTILKKIAVGTSKTISIKSTGQAQSCGANYENINGVYGQLGLGLATATTFSSPQSLNDPGVNYLSVVSGEIQSCGITSNQTIKCWGDNVGDGSGVVKNSPTLISDDGLTKYIDIASGSYHVCAITSAGVMKCWGDGWEGKLGTGNNSGQSSPITAISGTSFKKVAAGANHTCGITDADAVLCWGTNSSGQTGDGTQVSPRLTAVSVDPGVSYSTIAAGENSTCGITTAGILKCWGANGQGQLGDNSTTTRPSPTVIDSGTTYSKIALSNTFYFHTCGITTSGILKCWGANNFGQLGDGGTTQSLVPIQIDSGVTYKEVSVTYGSSCGITTSGDLKCWGANASGQLGLGHTNPQNTPALVGTGY